MLCSVQQRLLLPTDTGGKEKEKAVLLRHLSCQRLLMT